MSHSIILFPVNKKEAVTLVTKVPGYIRKLASSLMLTVQISEGTSMVHIIGKGDEHSNQRAIETWLMNHYSQEEIDVIDNLIDTLTNTLIQYINNKQEIPSC